MGCFEKKSKVDDITDISSLPGDMADHKELAQAAVIARKITGPVDHLIINGAYLYQVTKDLSPRKFNVQKRRLEDKLSELTG